MQPPSIGRRVITLIDPARNNGADVAPAVIVRVWGERAAPLRGWTVNLKVHNDQYESSWLTSVVLYDTEEEARAATVNGGLAAFWPARV